MRPIVTTPQFFARQIDVLTSQVVRVYGRGAVSGDNSGQFALYLCRQLEGLSLGFMVQDRYRHDCPRNALDILWGMGADDSVYHTFVIDPYGHMYDGSGPTHLCRMDVMAQLQGWEDPVMLCPIDASPDAHRLISNHTAWKIDANQLGTCNA